MHNFSNNLEKLFQFQQKPEPFTPGEPLFWNDPHISKQMLAAHLDSTIDCASRRPHIIDQSVKWIIKTLGLSAGDRLLDLGCGPGLYAARFAGLGLQVTGVDYSQRSIDYAVQYAREHLLDIQYRYQNYLELNESPDYDAALLIFGDFCPLAPAQRQQLLRNIHQALEPDGFFVLDVSTREHRKRYGSKNQWYALESGFWKAGPHLVLEQGFDYPEQSIYLDQMAVLEANGKLSVYRNWFQDYIPETITHELEAGGFKVSSIWSDLCGTAYEAQSEWIGVVAQKVM